LGCPVLRKRGKILGRKMAQETEATGILRKSIHEELYNLAQNRA